MHIRWMIRRDLPEVLAIEAASFEYPWLECNFIEHLRHRDIIGMVAERGLLVVGFMVYKLNKTSLELLDLAVHPDYRRQGIGRAMVEKQIEKLRPDRRAQLTFILSEANTDGHLFLRVMGFKAVNVLRRYWDNGEDGYLFSYQIPSLARSQ